MGRGSPTNNDYSITLVILKIRCLVNKSVMQYNFLPDALVFCCFCCFITCWFLIINYYLFYYVNCNLLFSTVYWVLILISRDRVMKQSNCFPVTEWTVARFGHLCDIHSFRWSRCCLPNDTHEILKRHTLIVLIEII